MVDRPARLLLALDPQFLFTTTANTATMVPPVSTRELYAWDLSALCGRRNSLALNNQSVTLTRMVTPSWPDSPRIEMLVKRTAGSAAMPPLPASCQQMAVRDGDDDALFGDNTLNLTEGVMHCSHAGLTEIPPLPNGVRYL